MDERIRKYAAECIGTFVLVFLGCGAMHYIDDVLIMGVTGAALAFGLSLTAMVYAFGSVSGCHINPAVTLAMWIRRRIGLIDMAGYWIAQLTGAMLAMIVLGAVLGNGLSIGTYSVFACNDTINLPNAAAGMAVEMILTFVFVFTWLGLSQKKGGTSAYGLILGLTLTLVHIAGTNLTGTSVNPARSIAPAVYNGEYTDLWVFIIGPMLGAALAAFASMWFHPEERGTGR